LQTWTKMEIFKATKIAFSSVVSPTKASLFLSLFDIGCKIQVEGHLFLACLLVCRAKRRSFRSKAAVTSCCNNNGYKKTCSECQMMSTEYGLSLSLSLSFSLSSSYCIGIRESKSWSCGTTSIYEAAGQQPAAGHKRTREEKLQVLQDNQSKCNLQHGFWR
jgi:hypothetical protein